MERLALARILVVKLADIGDVLTSTPALRALRRSYPRAQVDLLTTPAAAQAVPADLADRVWTAPRNLARGVRQLPAAAGLLLDLRRQRYDAVLFLHHLTLASGVWKYRLLAAASGAPVLAGLDNGRGGWLTHAVVDQGFGAKHEVAYWLAVAGRLGARTADTGLVARSAATEATPVDGWLANLAPGPRVVIHPGSGGYAPARRWDPGKWGRLADLLVRRYGVQIILVGTASDGAETVAAAMDWPVLNLAGKTSLPQLAALLERCQLFLGADSGVMHLAVAAGVPVVALFGPSNHLAWGPWAPAERARVVRLGLNCSPCSYVGHRVGQREGCWHRSCMADLQPEQVLQAVEALDVLESP